MRRLSPCAPRADRNVRGVEIRANPLRSVCRRCLPLHQTNARMGPVTTHTADRKMPSKIGAASTTNQKSPSGRLVSRKPAAALSPAKDGGRRGRAESYPSSALGPMAIGSDTRYYLSRASLRLCPSLYERLDSATPHSHRWIPAYAVVQGQLVSSKRFALRSTSRLISSVRIYIDHLTASRSSAVCSNTNGFPTDTSYAPSQNHRIFSVTPN